MTLLDVQDLRTEFVTPSGVVHAVDGVSFSLQPGETLGIVGESGSGKSVTALTLLRLFGPLTKPRVSGRVTFEGRDLLRLPERALRRVRGARIAMILQDPLTSLNPGLPIGDQVAEAVCYHRGLSRTQGRTLATDLLEMVGIPDAGRRLDDLPYQFSGGMRQRIMIAQAISCQPAVLIADEPTTALDVTVQAQVLLLLDRLRRELNMAMILISHDFGVVAAVCDRVLVMYGGRPAEHGTIQQILESPRHPYTRALLQSVPRLDDGRGESLSTIPGQPITVLDGARGCRFAPRCTYAVDRCFTDEPPAVSLGPDHLSHCWRVDDLDERTTATSPADVSRTSYLFDPEAASDRAQTSSSPHATNLSASRSSSSPNVIPSGPSTSNSTNIPPRGISC
jgi:oligopeptide/dipeptide ABC transporter ATP-binding protein